MKKPQQTLLKASLGLAAASAALLCASAQAQTQTLYIGMNGGNMERTYTQFVFPPFEKAHNVKVVVVPGTSTDILAKAQAAKGKAQMHVMTLDDGIMYRAIGMGLCEKIQPSGHMASLPDIVRIKDHAVGLSMGLTGLAYSTKAFADQGWAPPTSWGDLADAKYKGKVVVQSMPASSFGLHAFLMFNRLKGGNESNVNPGFEAWPETIGPNVVEYIPNSSKIVEMMQAGDAALFPYTFTQTELMKSKGIPMEFVAPKEGAVVLMTAQCALADNPDSAMALKLMDYLVSPQAQALAMEHGSYNPVNPQAPLKGKAAEDQARMNDILKTAVVLDWDVINAERPAWSKRWNRTVER
ncbi:extracellular solute-binding protein [Vandammella animalimorsus]|uniref:Spermidine/putrescine ABC transporter substrate-binding protein n=1 Tax=Vandammella animalimorsus TaxID=2029117 RepID=A0A2A2A8Z8_9BURK|nr:extracellular solute-binding protein [Vandammella animalimorsus]PAT34218.1 spermidine/putrescine ABC transporter substrate-binding protein [Vandammella animalimorsus]